MGVLTSEKTEVERKLASGPRKTRDMGTHVDQQAGPIVHTICRGGWENLEWTTRVRMRRVVRTARRGRRRQRSYTRRTQGLQIVKAHNIYLSATLLLIVGGEDLVEAELRRNEDGGRVRRAERRAFPSDTRKKNSSKHT